MELGNKSYSCKKGTYNAMWRFSDGRVAFWGSYNPYDKSYYLAMPGGVLGSGMWLEDWDGNYEFQAQGCYDYTDVRRAIQLGIL